MNYIRTVICLITLLVLAGPAHARRPADQDWRQVETEHFLIVYPEANAAAAGRLAAISENYYASVREMFGYAPPGKTPIVLNNRMDLANGYAQSIFRKMEYFLAAPDSKTFGPKDPPWLASLFVHEFAHLCQGMRDDGFTRVLTTVFGEVNGTNYVAPRWWVEGVCVYAETQLAPGGRGENAYQHMVMAANLLSEEPWSLGQIGVYPAFAFPADRVYVPGYDMIAKLQSLYAKDGLMDVLASQQSAWPFFGLGYVWKRKTGYSPGTIWEMVQKEKNEEYAGRYGQDRLPAPDAFEVAGSPTDFYEQPSWTRRNTLLVFRHSLKGADAILEVEPRNGNMIATRLAGGLRKGRYGYDVQKDRVVAARLFPDLLYQDAYQADLVEADEQGGERRLTRGQRCWSPAVAPDGTVVCIVPGDGGTRLALIDKVSREAVPMQSPVGAQVASPSWSPQGYQLAVSVCINGVQDICLVDPQTQKGQAICGWDQAADWDPVWSPDNQYVLFVSDRSGTHQIYAYRIEDKKLFKVTDAFLGAFDPAVSWDMKLIAFAEYRPGNTQRIMLAPFDPETWQEVSLGPVQSRPAADPAFTAPPAKGDAYSAWPQLLPSLWLPMAGMDRDGYTWGAISAKRDLLENHEWIGQALFQPRNQHVYADFAYTYSGLPVEMALRAYRLPDVRYGLPGDYEDATAFWSCQTGLQATGSMTFLLSQTDVSATMLQAQAGLDARRILEADRDAYPGEFYGGLSGTLVFQHLNQSAWDLFPTSGVILTARVLAGLMQQDYDGRFGSAAATWIVPGPVAHHAAGVGVRACTKAGIFPVTFDDIAPQGYHGGQFNAGNNLTLSAYYRVPLVHLDRGPGLFPMFFHDLWAEAVLEQGAGWDGGLNREQWETNAVASGGVNVHLDTELFWYLPARITQRITYVAQDEAIEAMMEINLGL